MKKTSILAGLAAIALATASSSEAQAQGIIEGIQNALSAIGRAADKAPDQADRGLGRAADAVGQSHY